MKQDACMVPSSLQQIGTLRCGRCMSIRIYSPFLRSDFKKSGVGQYNGVDWMYATFCIQDLMFSCAKRDHEWAWFPTVVYGWVRIPILQRSFPLPSFRASATEQMSKPEGGLPLCIFKARFWSPAFVLGSCLVDELWAYISACKCNSAGVVTAWPCPPIEQDGQMQTVSWECFLAFPNFLTVPRNLGDR